jgi:predicted porin
MDYKKWIIRGVGVMFAVLLIWALFLMPSEKASAADLGGTNAGLADLEERIAELEATTARKGTKKVSLIVYGQVNKALLYYDIEDFSDTRVIENGASETFVGFAAKVQINKDLAAGGVIELGQGRTFLHAHEGFFDDTIDLETDNDVYARQSYVYLSTQAGKLSVGLQSMATDDFSSANVAATDAVKRLTAQPLGGLVVSHWFFGTVIDGELEPFNGKKAEAVRYDSPTLAGFSASAAWETGSDSWDAALKYGGELAGFVVIGSVGYEIDKADDLLEDVAFLGALETKTLSANVGVKHLISGLFVQGSWARLEIEEASSNDSVETDAWHVQAGWEAKFLAFGPTTVWGGLMQWDDLNLKAYEIGLNQNLGGAVDAYVVGRTFELDDLDGQSVLGGMRVRF